MLANFERLGVRFHYPEGWELDSAGGEREITVYSPGGAFWSVTIYEAELDSQEIVDQVVAAMREEYPELDVTPLTETLEGFDYVGCEMNFYYLDLTSTAIARVFRGMWANYLVIFQAEDREFAEYADVFAAMTQSFLLESNLRGQPLNADFTDEDEGDLDDDEDDEARP
ncbi:MAG: hypothetical protein QM811_17295 [Pirellulales bacterium]